MAALGAPKAISPLIKFCRWGALLGGIAYGSMRYSTLAKKEVVIQEHEDKIRARIAARKAAEREASTQAEMASLGKECGVGN